jgi:hypothetical protein
MDFNHTKYQGNSMKPHDASSTHDTPRSADDLAQPSLLPDSVTHQKTNTKGNAASLPRSKYEMNLAEFPLALLAKRKLKEVRVIEYEDTIIGANGELIHRKWAVSPSARFGFGSTAITALLFELFQIWKEQGFASRNIHFQSIYNLIQRMGDRTTSDKAYERIRNDLTVLYEISVEAKNAFWDNEKKAYVTKGFHLFDSITIYHRNEKTPHQEVLPFSYITASETLMQSVAANAVITLSGVNRELFHSLTPTQQRLGLYLTKMLYKSTEHRRDVEKLAQQLPITAKTYRDSKSLIKRACEGLIKKQFPYLTGYRFEPSRRQSRDNIVFLRQGTLTPHASNATNEDEDVKKMYALLVDDILAVTGASDRREFYTRAVRALPKPTILTCLSLTNAAKQQQQIKKTPDRYFTGLILEYATQHGIHI